MGILWRPQCRILSLDLHMMCLAKCQNEILGPWLWAPGFRACYNRTDAATSATDGKETCLWGTVAAVPNSLQTPQTPESGERDGRNGQKFNNGEDQRGAWTGQTRLEGARGQHGLQMLGGQGATGSADVDAEHLQID